MIIIGEKINATRKSVAKAIIERDKEAIKEQIIEQDKAGAHYIDLNAGVGRGSDDKELEDMKWLIDIALNTTQKKLSIDSSNPFVIKKAAEYVHGKREWMLNSIKDDPHITDEFMPIVKEYNIPVIALAMNASGIPEEAEERLTICKHLCQVAGKFGVNTEQLYFDPLVLPLSTKHTHSKTALTTLTMIKTQIPRAKTTMGASNVSYGLPNRKEINKAFLIAAQSHGLDSAICDPTITSIKHALILGKLISGEDKFCRYYTRSERNGVFE